MSSVLDNLKGRITDGLSGVVDAGKTSLKISGLRSQVRKLEREKEDRLTALGHQVYAMVQADRIDQQELASLCQPITVLNDQLADLQKQIAEIESFTSTGESDFAHCTCGGALTPNSRFCRGCGKNVEDIVRAALAVKEAAVDLTRCACGAILGPDSAFCAKCGKPVIAEASAGVAAESGAPVRSEQMEPETLSSEHLPTEVAASPVLPADTCPCPSCGQVVPARAKFCRHCGESTADRRMQ